MITQNRDLSYRFNRTTKLPASNIYGIFDNLTSGGSLIGSSRVVTDTTGAFTFGASSLSILSSSRSETNHTIHYTTPILKESLLNLKLDKDEDGVYNFGLTELGTPAWNGRPTEGIILNSAETWVKRVANSNTSLGLSWDNLGDIISIVIYYKTSDDFAIYYRDESMSDYSLLSTYAVTAITSGDARLGFSVRNVGSPAGIAYRLAYVNQPYVSLSQLNVLFPLF